MSGTTRTPYPLLNKPGGRPVLAGAGKGPLLTAPPAAPGTGGTGTGTGTGTGGTGTYTGTIEALRLTAATPTLPVPLRVMAEEAYTNPPVCCGLAFGPGDVPSTHRVRLRTGAGAEVPVQQDDETRWPDGSLKYCVARFIAPDAFAAGQVIFYTVDAVAGAANRAASYTLDQIKNATDFRVEITGHSLGSAVGVLSVNDLITAGKVNSWGANPKGGIETVASGPICQEWKFWTVARRKSDGAYHESIRLECYLRRWTASGAYEMVARQRQPNIYGANAGSTWSTATWTRGNANYVQGFNGATRLWAIGGPNDRDARTVPASQFNASAGTYTIPAGQNLGQVSAINDRGGAAWTGLGVAFGVAGNIPGGMSAQGCYWWAWNGRILSDRNNGDSAISFTAPAGNVQVFPLVATFPGTGVVCADEQGDPFWIGPGARPRVRVGHDDAYLTRTSRLFAPLDLALPRPAQPVPNAQLPYQPYRPGQVLGQQWWDWGLEGDDWDKDRVGWLSRQHANLLLTPFDRLRRTHCISLAFMQNDAHFDWEDERSGRIVVGNNGPSDNGTTYPEMGPVMPTLFMTQRDDMGINSASPGFAAMAYYNKGGSGYRARYDNLGEASHYPSWQIVPYLLTGHRVFLDIMRTNTALMTISHDAGKRQSRLAPPYVPAARRFYNVFFDQGRSQGWSRLAMSNLRHVLPDGHPERPYLDDVADQQATYWGAIAPYSPWRMFGNVPICPSDGNLADANYRAFAEYMTQDQNVGFHNIYELFGTLVCMLRGESKYKPAVQVYLNYLQHAADDQLYPEGTGFFTGHYFTRFRDNTTNAYFTSRAQWIRTESAILDDTHPGVQPPYPSDRNFAGNFHAYNDPKADPGPGAFGAAYIVQHCAALGLAAWLANPDGSAMFPDTARVRRQLINRVIAHPDNQPAVRERFPLSSDAYPNEMVAQWSVTPPGI